MIGPARFAPPSREGRKRRTQFGKDLKRALRERMKGAGWKMRDAWLFRERSGWFLDIMTIPHGGEPRTLVYLHIKPMALDEVYWEIAGLSENKAAPLSLRADGAFVCRVPPVRERWIDDANHSRDCADRIAEFVEAEVPPSLRQFETQSYSSWLASRARMGACLSSESLVCALTAEGDLRGAAQLAEDIRSGKQRYLGIRTRFAEGDFISLARDWLAARLTAN